MDTRLAQAHRGRERRSSPRLPLTLPVILIRDPGAGATRHDAFAEDLSLHGALVRTRLRLQPGEVVAFHEPTTGFTTTAKVLHADDLRLGLEFLDTVVSASLWPEAVWDDDEGTTFSPAT